MSPIQLENSVQLVGADIHKASFLREAIPVRERLVVTSRYMASGDSMASLANHFSIGDPTHVVIQCPRNAGSSYHNFKRRHSIILIAVCDSEYNCLYFDVGSYGRRSEGGVYDESSLSEKLRDGLMDIPPPEIVVEGQPFLHYCFFGDEAFPLLPLLMCPFPGKGICFLEHKIFNDRMGQPRRYIENTFGILHYNPEGLADREDEVGQIIPGKCNLANIDAGPSRGSVPVKHRGYDEVIDAVARPPPTAPVPELHQPSPAAPEPEEHAVTDPGDDAGAQQSIQVEQVPPNQGDAVPGRPVPSNDPVQRGNAQGTQKEAWQGRTMTGKAIAQGPKDSFSYIKTSLHARLKISYSFGLEIATLRLLIKILNP
ncbi:hypothetical protein QAD02_015138 [Eretmocerus hayati]|uniref:Uncharacterized protein n=1 Tax=Eretmocerus hayati TaxID=131215 RepID=A0ACC2P8M3_9HYME|nr:hypothetical protein QAD02_015138 [Eretmocerus hayati]